MRIEEASTPQLLDIVQLLADDDVAKSRGYPTGITDEIREMFDAISADTHNQIFVAIVNDAIVGMFQLTTMPCLSFGGEKRAQIESVRIRREVRSQGLGRAMMELAVTEAKRRGATCIQLMSHSERTEAHGFYGSLGFEATHTGFKLRL